jgi:hypothetical protein
MEIGPSDDSTLGSSSGVGALLSIVFDTLPDVR